MIAGPAWLAAAWPVRTKIPAPITAPTPSSTRWRAVRVRLSVASPCREPSTGSPASTCGAGSTGLTLNRLFDIGVSPGEWTWRDARGRKVTVATLPGGDASHNIPLRMGEYAGPGPGRGCGGRGRTGAAGAGIVGVGTPPPRPGHGGGRVRAAAGGPGRSVRARAPGGALHRLGLAGGPHRIAHAPHPPSQARPLAAAGRACRRRPRSRPRGAARGAGGVGTARPAGGAGHLRPRPALDPRASRGAGPLALRRALRGPGGGRRGLRGRRGIAGAGVARDPGGGRGRRCRSLAAADGAALAGGTVAGAGLSRPPRRPRQRRAATSSTWRSRSAGSSYTRNAPERSSSSRP